MQSPKLGRLKDIPTNVITGFLGSGKTTAILNLLDDKPAGERWAVLVNEFGSVGIDGAIYEANNQAFVKEVPGGCLCCSVGVPIQVAVNRLLREARPDRLLLEPSGLGHPRRILETLRGQYFRGVVDLRATICLVDPRKLGDRRYSSHENFIDQMRLADVLIANKTDLVDNKALRQFARWAGKWRPVKAVIAQTVQGRLARQWLDLPSEPARCFAQVSGDQLQRVGLSDAALAMGGQHGVAFDNGLETFGWVFPKEVTFNFQKLKHLLVTLKPSRMKGLFMTDQGNFVFNACDGLITVNEVDFSRDSRIEFIQCASRAEQVRKGLTACIESV